jgi:hypothetical protein
LRRSLKKPGISRLALETNPAWFVVMLSDRVLMRTATECSSRAEKCRRLTKDSRAEDWGHFLEMGETWEMLSKHRHERARQQTIALADQFRNVLFLSTDAA